MVNLLLSNTVMFPNYHLNIKICMPTLTNVHKIICVKKKIRNSLGTNPIYIPEGVQKSAFSLHNHHYNNVNKVLIDLAKKYDLIVS